MRIQHVAVWVTDLEATRLFYAEYFGATSSARYENPAKQFSSYFLSFPDGGARLEIMHNPSREAAAGNRLGYAHIAISVLSREAVDGLFARLRDAGFTRSGGAPRITGDGYDEALAHDPDGFGIEITV